MVITTKISMDLRRAGYPGIVHAVQNDTNSRAVELRLMDNGVAWIVPDGVTAAVGYRKEDGTNGLYDTLPNGIPAVTIAGSVITAILAPQMLAVPGNVSMVLILLDTDLNRLATFPIILIVEEDPAANATKSENYYKYSTMEQLSNAVEETLRNLDETNKTLQDKIANGDFIGETGKTAYEYAVDGGYTGTEEDFSRWMALKPLLPTVTEEDNSKILQVVNGAWAAVKVEESSVKTFVDDYISSALEGDY